MLKWFELSKPVQGAVRDCPVPTGCAELTTDEQKAVAGGRINPQPLPP